MAKNPQIFLISIRQKSSDWVEIATKEYIKRLSGQVEEISIRPPSRNIGKNLEELLILEADLIYEVIKKHKFEKIVLFDEKGSQYSSQSFAIKIQQFIESGKCALILGGADGFYPQFKAQAHELVSLSKMTFPHEVARVVVLEQIYRAITIINHHPYHRN